MFPLRRVLCIGDEPVGLNRRCQFLREHRWSVKGSGNAYAGLQSIAHSPVDVVVLDLNSDEAENALIAGALKRQHHPLPVVIVAAQEDVPVLSSLADAVVPKPEDYSCLLTVLDGLLSPPHVRQ
ncbi:MAG TPA: response regulator [Candidatus Solibacter sp.]|nr:response regulator [Candidatus Solibacter sp.]